MHVDLATCTRQNGRGVGLPSGFERIRLRPEVETTRSTPPRSAFANAKRVESRRWGGWGGGQDIRTEISTDKTSRNGGLERPGTTIQRSKYSFLIFSSYKRRTKFTNFEFLSSLIVCPRSKTSSNFFPLSVCKFVILP